MKTMQWVLAGLLAGFLSLGMVYFAEKIYDNHQKQVLKDKDDAFLKGFLK